MRRFLKRRSLADGRKTSFGFRLILCVSLCLAGSVSPAQAGVKVTYAKGPEVAAMFLKFGTIDYPREARRLHWSGNGIFRVYVRPNGTVKTVGVVKSTGHPDLDLAAAAGLYHCLARPGGRREIDMPVSFTLSRRYYHPW